MYYYETYDEQGGAIPTQAVDGLLFAVELVPRDFDLRLLAVRQLVKENDSRDASATFGQSPTIRTPERRSGNLDIMDKIKKGDTQGALRDAREDKKKAEGTAIVRSAVGRRLRP